MLRSNTNMRNSFDVRNKEVKRPSISKCNLEFNILVCRWCCLRGFGFFGNSVVFKEKGLLSKDPPNEEDGRTSFAHRLCDLVRRALKLGSAGLSKPHR